MLSANALVHSGVKKVSATSCCTFCRAGDIGAVVAFAASAALIPTSDVSFLISKLIRGSRSSYSRDCSISIPYTVKVIWRVWIRLDPWDEIHRQIRTAAIELVQLLGQLKDDLVVLDVKSLVR